jgi:hypothetical protein
LAAGGTPAAYAMHTPRGGTPPPSRWWHKARAHQSNSHRFIRKRLGSALATSKSWTTACSESMSNS